MQMLNKRNLGEPEPGRALGMILMASLFALCIATAVALADEAVVAHSSAALATVPDESRLKDPMRPNWYGLKPKNKMRTGIPRLSSIVASDARRLAVINGAVMREGETKNGVLLRQVLPDRVLVVTADQQLLSLKLRKPHLSKER